MVAILWARIWSNQPNSIRFKHYKTNLWFAVKNKYCKYCRHGNCYLYLSKSIIELFWGRKEEKTNMSLKMKDLPESERPYEKIQMYGTDKLSDSELLAIIIKCGTKEDTSVGLAQKILNLRKKDQKDLRFLQEVSIEELTKIKGIGKVKAIQIMATCELAKRMSKPIHSLKIVIKSTKDVADLLMDELKYEKREIVKLLILNSKNVVLKNINISLRGRKFC